MPGTIAAIPTKYKGIQFRSRLEATWAAFFDNIDWLWDYEPFDRSGWIPDFALKFPSGVVLVECKPFVRLEDAAQYIEKPMIDSDELVVVVGSSLFDKESESESVWPRAMEDLPSIGVFAEKGWPQDLLVNQASIFVCKNHFGLARNVLMGRFECLYCSHRYEIPVAPATAGRWAAAKNEAQYKRPVE